MIDELASSKMKDFTHLTLDDITSLMIQTKREIKSLKRQISSILHLIDKNGVEAIYREDVLITIYRKSERLHY